MKMPMYSVYDAKAEYYLNPFVLRNSGEALRGFSDVVKDKNSLIGAHPEDFYLYEIGCFDTDKGMLIPNHTPVIIAKAIELINVKNMEVVKDEIAK